MAEQNRPKPMAADDAARIQSDADRKGKSDGFKERAQAAAARNQGAKK